VQTLRRTPLYERQAALGARFVPFAGWELPVRYASIVQEHRAVRERAGVFDVSHMGQLEVTGDGAHAYLQERLSNDLDRIAAGQAQYTLLTNERGGVEDDLIAYRRDDGYLLVVNASNAETDAGLLARARDVSAGFAMLAVQGPQALARLGIDVAPFTWRRARVLGVACIVCGTGYTGERGCELLCDPGDAPALWDAVLAQGVEPCGLGARDTLRLEAGLPLHGQELTPERTPIEAGLAWACALRKDFTGVEVLRIQQEEGTRERLAAFVMEEKAIPRAGMRVEEGGTVTSGAWSPTLEQGIGLAYLPAALAEPGTTITINLRERSRVARVVPRPIYRRKEQ
jgi:aminomethyltransferase